MGGERMGVLFGGGVGMWGGGDFSTPLPYHAGVGVRPLTLVVAAVVQGDLSAWAVCAVDDALVGGSSGGGAVWAGHIAASSSKGMVMAELQGVYRAVGAADKRRPLVVYASPAGVARVRGYIAEGRWRRRARTYGRPLLRCIALAVAAKNEAVAAARQVVGGGAAGPPLDAEAVRFTSAGVAGGGGDGMAALIGRARDRARQAALAALVPPAQPPRFTLPIAAGEPWIALVDAKDMVVAGDVRREVRRAMEQQLLKEWAESPSQKTWAGHHRAVRAAWAWACASEPESCRFLLRLMANTLHFETLATPLRCQWCRPGGDGGGSGGSGRRSGREGGSSGARGVGGGDGEQQPVDDSRHLTLCTSPYRVAAGRRMAKAMAAIARCPKFQVDANITLSGKVGAWEADSSAPRDVGRFLQLVGLEAGGKGDEEEDEVGSASGSSGSRSSSSPSPAVFGVFDPTRLKHITSRCRVPPGPLQDELVSEWRRCLIKGWEEVWAARGKHGA